MNYKERKPEAKAKARELRYEGYLLKDIVKKVGASFPTVCKWCKDIPTDKHRLSNINLEKREAICDICGPVKIWKRGYRKNGKPRIGCSNRVKGKPNKPTICNRCGFEALVSAQIDCHHIDYNHSNNDLDNIEWLCANCHRLEHFQ